MHWVIEQVCRGGEGFSKEMIQGSYWEASGEMCLLAGMESRKDPDTDWLAQLGSSGFSLCTLLHGLLQVEQLESLSTDEDETDRAARRALSVAFRLFRFAVYPLFLRLAAALVR
jgi:hypothetical protein